MRLPDGFSKNCTYTLYNMNVGRIIPSNWDSYFILFSACFACTVLSHKSMVDKFYERVGGKGHCLAWPDRMHRILVCNNTL